jgi:hypothetical protein
MIFLAGLAGLLVSCGSEPKPAPSPTPTKVQAPNAPRALDESGRFPKDGLVETKLVDKELMGKSFMPGGTWAHYKKGKKEYEMFVAKLRTALDAALILPDWHKALVSTKMEPMYGGYFGMDAGRPVFVFTKGVWIAGIVGLPENEADANARVLAAYLN